MNITQPASGDTTTITHAKAHVSLYLCSLFRGSVLRIGFAANSLLMCVFVFVFVFVCVNVI